jgi:hypothetical protein
LFISRVEVRLLLANHLPLNIAASHASVNKVELFGLSGRAYAVGALGESGSWDAGTQSAALSAASHVRELRHSLKCNSYPDLPLE